jgi:ornithine carrier protein
MFHFSPLSHIIYNSLFILIRTPIELVKCKMQVQMLIPQSLALSSSTPMRAKLPGPISVLSTVIRTTGFRGLWLGHTGTLIRETGGTAAWFTSKEFVASALISLRRSPSIKGKRKDTELQAWESALSGACAGIAYNVALFPADTIKSSIQTEEELHPRTAGLPRHTFISMARDMWKKKGLRGLYAGCGITVIRSMPSSALIFLIYDGLVRRFG